MLDPDHTAKAYRFLPWHYAPEGRQLCGPDGEVRLKPLLDRLLRKLLDEPGTVLSREHLIEQVWTRRGVNDEVLSRAIAELRGLLADDAREPRFIETLPKGGYRWVAPVSRVGPDGSREPMPDDRSVHIDAPRRRPSILLLTCATLILALALGLAWRVTTDHEPLRASLAVDLLDARPLATDPRLEFDPRFDPAGRVFYIRADQHSDASELLVIDPATRAERVLWHDAKPLRHPTPSPNGSEVALTRWTAQACELWSVAVVDARRTRLGDCASAAGGLEWVDSGAALIYTGAASDITHAPGLMLLDRRSGKHGILTTPDANEGAHVDPRVSADGRVLVYASMRSDERQMWLTTWPPGRERMPLLQRPEPAYGHAFESSGDTLWIAGDLTRYRALHRLRRNGQPELIGGVGALSIDLAANGAAVWSEARYDADIWLKRDADAQWTVIARSNRYESQPEFSADGTKIALISNRGGPESVLVHDLDDQSTHPLILNPEFRWVRPTWSAKDQSLILTAYEQTRTRLYRYRPEGNTLNPLPDIPEGAFQGIELVDRLLYLAGHGTPTSTLMQKRDGKAQSENLGFGPVSAYRASEDWIAWRRPGSPNLRIAPVRGREPVREVVRVDDGMIEAFALTADHLLFVDQGQLWSLKLPHGLPTPLSVDHPPDGNGPNLAVSRDGALATVSVTSLNMDLMIASPPVARNP